MNLFRLLVTQTYEMTHYGTLWPSCLLPLTIREPEAKLSSLTGSSLLIGTFPEPGTFCIRAETRAFFATPEMVRHSPATRRVNPEIELSL